MNTAGTVSVKFTVANAEVVRQALANLGKDGEKALKQFDTSAAPANKSMRTLSGVIEEMRDRAAGFAVQGGSVGGMLLRLGPAGLAAGAAIGVAAVAIAKATNAAGEFALQNANLRDSAALLRINTDQLQAIIEAGADFGIQQEATNKALVRFAGVLEDVRKGQGSFFDLALKTDPALARQLATTENLGDALAVFVKLYEKAGSAQARFAAEAFGQRNTNVALLAQAIELRGGVDKTTEAYMRSGDAIDKQMIEKTARLKLQIDEMAEAANRNIAAIFSETVLENVHRYVSAWRDITRLAREFSLSPSLERFLTATAQGFRVLQDDQARQIIQSGEAGARRLQLESLESRRGFLRTAIADKNDPANLDPAHLRDLQVELAKIESRIEAIVKAGEKVRLDIEVPVLGPGRTAETKANPQLELAIYQKQTTALGAAITPAEQLRLKQLELAAAVDAYGVSQENANRALGAFKVAQQQAAVAMRMRLGVASEEQMVTARLAELADLRAKGFIRSNEEMAEAERMVRKEVRETARAMEVRRSGMPALTQLAQDAGDVKKQLDAGFAGSLRAIGSEFSLLNNTTATFNERLRNIALRFADVALQAVVMKNIVGPLASAFSGGTGNIFGIFGFAEGGVMTPNGPLPLKRYAGGGIADSPQLALFGEGRQREAYVPLPDGRSIPVTIAGAGAGGNGSGGAPYYDNRSYDFRGADPQAIAAINARLDTMEKVNESMPDRVAVARRLRPTRYNSRAG